MWYDNRSSNSVTIVMQIIMRIATRNSPLALWQATFVSDQLRLLWPNLQVKLLPMTTSGDQFLKDKLQTIGNKGLFVKELEEALLQNKADIAVHSMKDVPTTLPPGLQLTSILKRDNPMDALVCNHHTTFANLPAGAVIGTSSLRRQSQLLSLRPDLQIKTLRGNIHSRLQQLAQGRFDAIVLAVAGMVRMQLDHMIQEIFSDTQLLPACGQGALGIECRSGDILIQKLLRPLHDPETAICIEAERAINAALGGNCHTPLAAFCEPISASMLRIRAKVTAPDGQTTLQTEQMAKWSEATMAAVSCAQSLIAQGALTMLKSIP